jgi:transcriptional regulator with XRE-family HTH domain
MRKKTNLTDQYIQALSEEIKERRQEAGISQDDLADRAKVHRTYISLIERRSCNFSMQIFFRIAEALDVEPLELMQTAGKAVGSKKKKS